MSEVPLYSLGVEGFASNLERVAPRHHVLWFGLSGSELGV